MNYSQETRELLIQTQDEHGRRVELRLSPQATRALYEGLLLAAKVNGPLGDEVAMSVIDQRTFQ